MDDIRAAPIEATRSALQPLPRYMATFANTLKKVRCSVKLLYGTKWLEMFDAYGFKATSAVPRIQALLPGSSLAHISNGTLQLMNQNASAVAKLVQAAVGI